MLHFVWYFQNKKNKKLIDNFFETKLVDKF